MFFLSTQWKVGQDAIENRKKERVIKEHTLCYETKGRVKFFYGNFMESNKTYFATSF